MALALALALAVTDFAELPNVRWVLPDSYLDVKNKDYGGKKSDKLGSIQLEFGLRLFLPSNTVLIFLLYWSAITFGSRLAICSLAPLRPFSSFASLVFVYHFFWLWVLVLQALKSYEIMRLVYFCVDGDHILLV